MVTCPHGWPQSLALLEVELILHDSEPPQWTTLIRLVWSKEGPQQTVTLLSGVTFQRLRDYFSEGKGKSQISLWARLSTLLCRKYPELLRTVGYRAELTLVPTMFSWPLLEWGLGKDRWLIESWPKFMWQWIKWVQRPIYGYLPSSWEHKQDRSTYQVVKPSHWFPDLGLESPKRQIFWMVW